MHFHLPLLIRFPPDLQVQEVFRNASSFHLYFLFTVISVSVNEHLAYQFNVTGEAEGIFYAEVKEGKLYVEPYEYYDRDAIFTCSAETLFKINEGKLDPVLAVTLGKLKVEGNIEKALYLKNLIDSRKAEQNAIKKTQKQK